MQLQGFHIDTIHTNRCHCTGDKATTTHEQPKITSAIQTPSGSPDDKRPRGRVVVREERRQKERRGEGQTFCHCTIDTDRLIVYTLQSLCSFNKHNCGVFTIVLCNFVLCNLMSLYCYVTLCYVILSLYCVM